MNIYQLIRYLVDTSLGLLFIVSWVAGVVIATGWKLKLAAIFFFPYGWYLIVEKYLIG